MCFIFLFTWLTSTFKKMAADTGRVQRSLVKMWRPAVVMVNKMLQTGTVDDDILLGVTASCLVMHFWFDQYYCQCKNGIHQQHESLSWLSLQIWVPRSMLVLTDPQSGLGSSFVFLWLVHRSSVLWFFFCFGGGVSLLNQVMWAGAGVHLGWTN